MNWELGSNKVADNSRFVQVRFDTYSFGIFAGKEVVAVPQTQVPPTPPTSVVRSTNLPFRHQRRYMKRLVIIIANNARPNPACPLGGRILNECNLLVNKDILFSQPPATRPSCPAHGHCPRPPRASTGKTRTRPHRATGSENHHLQNWTTKAVTCRPAERLQGNSIHTQQ